MIDYSRKSRINVHLQTHIKVKTSAAIFIVLLFLLTSRLYADERKEYIYLDGKAIAVETDSSCGQVTLSPLSDEVVAAGAVGNNVTVNGVGSGCQWTAASYDSWITVDSIGSGTVSYTVAANTGPARQGMLTIADGAFIVTQANGCTYDISPASASLPASGGINYISVTCSDATCTPTAANIPSWITNVTVVGSGAEKTVSYTVAANTGLARTATITIGGQPFEVTQANGCQQECTTQNNICYSEFQSQAAAMCADSCSSYTWANCGGPEIPDCQVMHASCVSDCVVSAEAACVSSYNYCQTSCTDACRTETIRS
jgi:hypothetical protein